MTLIKVAAATTLQPHQQRVVDRLKNDDQPGLVAIHGLGSGKTLTSIAAADALQRQTHAIVPASLQANYAKELLKHKAEITPDVSTLQGVTRRGGLPSTDEDFLIVDEAHRLREPGTKAYQTVRDIPAAKRLLLTASPTYNRPSDIAALVNVAAGQRVLPADQRGFEERYVGEQRVDPGFMARVFRGIQPGSRPVLKNQKELGGILQKWTDYHENPTDTADFPTRLDETIEVPMSSAQQEVYKTLTNQAPAWVQYKVRRGLPPSKAESSDLNAFLTGARQAQLSPGVFSQTGMPGEATKQQAAFDRFKTQLDANPDHRALVYSNYLDAGLSPYRQLLDKHQIPYGTFTGDMKAQERAQAVKDYNEGKLRALLVSSAGGEGLDLKGTRQISILEPSWNEEKLKQVVGRGIRYQSHAELPEDQRTVAVERYLSTFPQEKGWRKALFGKNTDQTADQYLSQMSADKERLNAQVHDLLRGGNEKTATMSRARKDYRRALELLQNRDHAFHSTYHLDDILRTRKVLPGDGNAMSPKGVREIYAGLHHPAANYTSALEPTVALPLKTLEPLGARVLPETQQAPYTNPSETLSGNWLLTPNEAPLPPRSSVIALGAAVNPVLQRDARVHVIHPEQFYNALADTRGMSREDVRGLYGHTQAGGTKKQRKAVERGAWGAVPAATPAVPADLFPTPVAAAQPRTLAPPRNTRGRAVALAGAGVLTTGGLYAATRDRDATYPK